MSGDGERRFSRNLALVRSFILNALDAPSDGAALENLVPQVEELLAISRKCGAISLYVKYEDREVYVSTLDPEFWLRVVVRPSEPVR